MKRRTGLVLVLLAAIGCTAESPGREDPLSTTASINLPSENGNDTSESSGIARAGFASTTSSPTTAFPFLQDTARTVTRRIWAEADLGSVSPDGRYASITDWDTGDLAIRDLETGEVRYVTDNPEPWDPGMADAHRISRDGRWVAYTWSTQAVPTIYELRVVSVDGGEPRVICCDSFNGWMLPLDWSSDGRWVLVGREIRPERELVMVSVEDGSTRVLKTFDDSSPGGWVRRASFSPDGRHVAYDYHKEDDTTDYDIFVLEVATLSERVLVQSPAFDGLLGWAPDGNHILFQSDRGGTPGAWLLPVVDGEASSSPWLVKPDLWRVVGMGFGDAGRFFYTVRTGKRDVLVASFDPETKTVVGSTTPLTPRAFGNSRMPFWSPDGSHLAYAAETGPVPLQGEAWAPQSIVIQSLETGAVKELSMGVSGSPVPVGWTSDGRGVVVLTPNLNDPENRVLIQRVDTQADARQVLYRVTPDRSLAGFQLAPDQRSVFTAQAPVAGTGPATPADTEDPWSGYRIEREDLETGRITELFRTPPGGPGQVRGLTLSPDGGTLAFGYCPGGGPDRLVILPTEGGEVREITAGTFWSVAWLPDGNGLLAYGQIQENADLEVFYVGLSLETGPQPIGISGWVPGFSMDVHPRGDRIAYTYGTTGSELWVMENFLPEGDAEG
jgi:Tol biopolymer transport system component